MIGRSPLGLGSDLCMEGWPRGPRFPLPRHVQSAAVANGTRGTTTLTLTGVRPGNLLLAWVGYSQYTWARTLLTPNGWSKLYDMTSGSSSFAMFAKAATAQDDGGAFVAQTVGLDDGMSGVISEVEGWDRGKLLTAAAVGSTVTSPPVAGKYLALAAWKREYASTAIPPAYYRVVGNGGNSGYHQVIAGAPRDPRTDMGTQFSLTMPGGSDISMLALVGCR